METVQNRNLVAYNLASRSLRVAIWSSVLGTLGVVVGATGWLVQPQPQYFAAGDDGRVIEMVPVDHPMMKPHQLTNWAANAVTDSLAMDYLKYRDQLASAEQYFTTPGFNAYIKALQDSGNLESIKKNRYVVESTLDGSPTIIQEGNSGGRHYWQMRVPVQVGYHGAENVNNQKYDALITVVRVPTSESRYGVAIHRILLKNRR